MSASKMQISGVTVKASPVEVATPYFVKNGTGKQLNGSCQQYALDRSSLLKGRNSSEYLNRGDVVASKIDVDPTVFSPIGHNSIINSLIALCHVAFAEHRPMAITPDLLWHHISKAIAIHIHKYSEELRKKFVHHEGKMTLTIVTDKIDTEDWPKAFKEFRRQIEATLTEEGKAIISGKFSTTTEVIEDVSCIALMEAMARYYNYVMMCICGIPSVTLLGTRQDWVDLKNRSQRILDLLSTDDLKGDISLAWWKPSILSVLDKLIQCYDEPKSAKHMDWMARIYKSEREGYGGHLSICGWVNVFFPYLGNSEDAKKRLKNEWAVNDLVNPELGLKKYLNGEAVKRDKYGRVDEETRKYLTGAGTYPKALSTVNFILKELGENHDMMLNAGPCCLSEQTKDGGLPCPPGTLHAHFGWVIFKDSGSREDDRDW